ncbi:Mediator of RNA polymerase II transcription subunit 16 [Nymphaea thermarum]|nr:Mediator of RNA polymerase II transcription subunit 16 [Nymphaea thermarum]
MRWHERLGHLPFQLIKRFWWSLLVGADWWDAVGCAQSATEDGIDAPTSAWSILTVDDEDSAILKIQCYHNNIMVTQGETGDAEGSRRCRAEQTDILVELTRATRLDRRQQSRKQRQQGVWQKCRNTGDLGENTTHTATQTQRLTEASQQRLEGKARAKKDHNPHSHRDTAQTQSRRREETPLDAVQWGEERQKQSATLETNTRAGTGDLDSGEIQSRVNSETRITWAVG